MTIGTSGLSNKPIVVLILRQTNKVGLKGLKLGKVFLKQMCVYKAFLLKGHWKIQLGENSIFNEIVKYGSN